MADNIGLEENNEGTETSQTTQANEKMYTQKEFDDHMAKLKSSVAHKMEKQFNEKYGNLDELLLLKQQSNKPSDDAIKDTEKAFQKILSDKESLLSKYESELKTLKIQEPLLKSASKHKAVNAEQIKQLLINNVRLNDNGEVEVIDENGSLKYTDNGNRYSVDNLVSDFLLNNPHFVAATPATTHTKSSVGPTGSLKVNPSKLNMNDPKDREVYRQYRKENNIG